MYYKNKMKSKLSRRKEGSIKSKISRNRNRSRSESKIKKIDDTNTYYQLKNFSFKDLDVSKYTDPNVWEKPAKLPDEFQKLVYESYNKISSVFDKSRFYGLEGLEIKIKPSGKPSSPLNIISFDSPQKPQSYRRDENLKKTGVFNIIHFVNVPTNINPNNLSIIFMEKKTTGNRFFNKYKFEEVSRLTVKSGTTLIIPEETYFKFSNINSTDGILKMKVLVFQCYK
jgi:hypothetical protein